MRIDGQSLGDEAGELGIGVDRDGVEGAAVAGHRRDIVILALVKERVRQDQIIALHVAEMHRGVLELVLEEERPVVFEGLVDDVVDVLVRDLEAELLELVDDGDRLWIVDRAAHHGSVGVYLAQLHPGAGEI